MAALVLKYKDIEPTIEKDVFIAESSVVIGDTHIGERSSIWFNVTIRGDVNKIRIGKETNIQDNAMCHVTRKTGPLTIGDRVTIGHSAVLHACTVGDECLIGMGAILLDQVVIEKGAMVGAGSVVPPGKVVKSGTLWVGNPAKYARDLTAEEKAFLKVSAQNYVELSEEYRHQT